MDRARVLSDAEIATLVKGRAEEFARDEVVTQRLPAAQFVAQRLEFDPDPPEPAQAKEEDAPPQSDFAPSPAPPTIDLEAEKRTAFEAGKADAAKTYEAALREAQQKAAEVARWDADRLIEETCAPVIALLGSLVAQSNAREAELAQRIEAAVQELASVRAGQAIDALPAAFRARIEELARKTAIDSMPASITLHPADLEALSLEAGDLGGRLRADPALARGDVVLDFGDMEVRDTHRATGAP